MKENMLDILMYLLENYICGDIADGADEASLRVELQRAGFPDQEINKAFSWLDGLASMRTTTTAFTVPSGEALRVYTPEECNRLDSECRGFLLLLDQLGVLDLASREMVIDRVMAHDTDETDLTDLKCVIMLILFNQPGKEAAFAWMEDLLFEGNAGWLHLSVTTLRLHICRTRRLARPWTRR